MVIPTGGSNSIFGSNGYSWCCTPATAQGMTDAFNFNQIDNGVRAIQNGLCDGFYTTSLNTANLGTNIQSSFAATDRANLQGFNQVQSEVASGTNVLQNAINNGFNNTNSAIAQTNYNLKDCCCETRESIMESNFANQSGFNSLSNEVSNAACSLGRGQENIKYALAQATCDINANADKNTDRIINHMVQNEMDSLRTELQSAQFQLSQLAQTSNIINRLSPTPIPAWQVQSPYTSVYTYGCNGCGV